MHEDRAQQPMAPDDRIAPPAAALDGFVECNDTRVEPPILRAYVSDEFRPGDARVLIVDDDRNVRFVLRRTLEMTGYGVDEASSISGAREQLRRASFDLVLLDKIMPDESGLDLLAELAPWAPDIAVVLVTAAGDVDSAVAAMRAGAYDYLRKPFAGDVMLAAVERALRRRHLEMQNQRHRVRLEGLVEERTSDVNRLASRLVGTQAAIIRVACSVAESRDPETGAHLDRMAAYCRELALALPASVKAVHAVDEEYAERVAESAPLHDIGKVGIPDDILLKPGKLTPHEYAIMKTHPVIGHNILESVRSRMTSEDAQLLDLGSDICLGHHERYDGTGYPAGLAGEEIPLAARIAALADFYDAVTSARPYRLEAHSHEEARAMIVGETGRAFDPDIIRAFYSAEERMVTLREELCEAPV